MSAAMAAQIDQAAAAAGLTAPAWLRAVVADRLDMPDQADRQPVARYGGQPADERALTALRLQLRQTGGLLKDEARAAREAGSASHPALEAVLSEVQGAILIIAGWQAERGAAG